MRLEALCRMDKAANRNTFYAHTLVDELWRAGLRTVVIAPGSRSTPLALAFGSHAGLTVYIHPDERGAAFFALGLGLASNRPTAILCTSGTAAVNFYPAVVEAHQSNVPLLVLTADRPPELRDSGSNQTIDQVKLFGSYVRWSVETPIPEKDAKETTLQALRSLAGRAMAAATGLPPGPVHLNLPFRKPLEPTLVLGDIPAHFWDPLQGFAQARPASKPYANISHGQVAASDAQVEALTMTIQHARRGIIYCGPRCPGDGFTRSILHLAQATGFPVFADALSGLRFHPEVNKVNGLVLGGYETFLNSAALRGLEPPDLVLQFGAVPTSKALGDFLGGLKAAARIQIDGSGVWSDDAFSTSDYLWADPERTLQAVLTELRTEGKLVVDTAWQEQWKRAERLCWQAVDQARRSGFFEGVLLADILDELSAEDSLFVASSLPVRHLDQFGLPRQTMLHVYANRGASGIDGTIASALGAAAANPDRRLVLVIGDLAFYHDLNSLLLLHKYNLKVTIVLINNDGGGIFRRLPVADFEPLFSQLFLVPHGLKFEHAARLFQLDYQYLPSGNAFRPAFRDALTKGSPHILEVSTDVTENERARQEVLQYFEQLWNSNLEISGDR
jgi:2-succinyl-5-enolpyruvyl-6-hydroxy-3-cyclohexene-1-carboxylate synthase